MKFIRVMMMVSPTILGEALDVFPINSDTYMAFLGAFETHIQNFNSLSSA